MGNYGIKVSQSGYDAKNCADNELLFSSSFPSLKIGLSGKLNPGDSGVIHHNLGYYPPFIVYVSAGGSAYSILGYSVINKTDLYTNLDLIIPDGYAVSYFIFLHDLESTIVPKSVISTPTTPVSHGDYGFKFSKEGNDVISATLDNLGLTSAYSNYIIHMSGYVVAVPSESAYSVAHNLGYIPHSFTFSRPTTDVNGDPNELVEGLHAQSIATGITYVDATNINFMNYSADTMLFYYIVFKEPIG